MRNMKKIIKLLLFSLIVFQANLGFSQKVVRYDLYVTDSMVNYAGKERRAIAVNGMIPMPILNFTEGDTAEIHVHNKLKEGTSLHWHGVYLPNKEDGVPFLTQKPIAPNSTFTYRFPIIQDGTHC
jgi:FtsP/CotA-like multicopper oxidase with cupredoxin domain